MIDHDAIAARVRQDRGTGTPGPWKAVAAGQADDLNEVVRFDPFQSIADAEGDTARRIAALPDLEAAYLDLYDEVQRLRAERDALQAQCCMCGKSGLSTAEDGGPECELDDGRWVCSVDCYDLAVLNHLVAEAERDRLRAALDDIAATAFWIANEIHIGPKDEGRALYDMALAIRDDARAALKGDSDA